MADRTVAVVGGGPAGLIAAEVLATAGVAVTVYEHKRSVGRKFLLAGRGGLNITHGEGIDDLLDRYGSGRSELEAAVRAFTPSDLRAWCAELGEPTFVGSSDRVFPESFRATPLLRAWLRRLDDLGVAIATGHRWTGWAADGALRFQVDGAAVDLSPDGVIFALGGASWPRVGSDGGWVAPLISAGIAVAELEPANCGVVVDWSPVLLDRFEGAPLKNVVFAVGDDNARGDAVITADGLEGGPIYALGPALRRELNDDRNARIKLDLHPDLEVDQLAVRLSKRRKGASVASWLRSAGLSPVTVALARETTANNLPQDPPALARLLKALPITVDSMAPIDRAISTAGGVSFDQLDDSFMLRSQPGTFIAGEMLDWEAPTGGYLLQACFSTGVAAAQGVLAWFERGRAN